MMKNRWKIIEHEVYRTREEALKSARRRDMIDNTAIFEVRPVRAKWANDYLKYAVYYKEVRNKKSPVFKKYKVYANGKIVDSYNDLDNAIDSARDTIYDYAEGDFDGIEEYANGRKFKYKKFIVEVK